MYNICTKKSKDMERSARGPGVRPAGIAQIQYLLVKVVLRYVPKVLRYLVWISRGSSVYY